MGVFDLSFDLSNDPNLDTSTHIVSFSRVTVDNNSVFINVQLLLNSDRTYQIFSATGENTADLSGNWSTSLQ